MRSAANRQSTGVPGLDELLGGGLIPGTLTVVVGATGIGKTQLGIQFARAGSVSSPAPSRHSPAPARPGVIFDMSARGDSQSHREYARRMFGWELTAADADSQIQLPDFFAKDREPGDY